MDQSIYLVWIYVSTILVLVVVLFYSLFLGKREKELKRKEKELMFKPEHLLKDAHQRALSIVKSATNDATSILDSSSKTSKNVEEKLQLAFDQALQEYLSVFKQDTASVEKEMLSDLQKVGADSKHQLESSIEELQNQSTRDLKQMEEDIESEHESLSSYLKQKVDLEYEKAKKEIESYKETQMADAQQKLDKKVQDLAMQILGKSLSTDEHTKLIIDALDRAKKDGFF